MYYLFLIPGISRLSKPKYAKSYRRHHLFLFTVGKKWKNISHTKTFSFFSFSVAHVASKPMDRLWKAVVFKYESVNTLNTKNGRNYAASGSGEVREHVVGTGVKGRSWGDTLDAGCDDRFDEDAVEKHEVKERGFTLMLSVGLD